MALDCPACGTRNRDGTVYCMRCGADVLRGTAEPPAREPRSHGRRVPVVAELALRLMRYHANDPLSVAFTVVAIVALYGVALLALLWGSVGGALLYAVPGTLLVLFHKAAGRADGVLRRWRSTRGPGRP